ncbi:MAG: tellurite resistance TerB family protein [Pseudomonadota bacterium]
MNLMDRLREAGRLSDTTLQKNVLTLAVSTMIADGDIDRLEHGFLYDLVPFSPLFAGIERREIASIEAAIVERIDAVGHTAAIEEAAAALSPALRETALCFAMRVAFVDGNADPGEIRSLETMAAFMKLSNDEFDGFARTIIALQRGPSAQQS